MSTERLYRTEGIIMRRREQGEADRVLTLCTPLGKIEVIVKGARKLRSRKAGHIELFTRSSFVISRVPNSWDIVSQAETIEPHKLLRGDLLRGTYARYAVELLDRFFAQGECRSALANRRRTGGPTASTRSKAGRYVGVATSHMGSGARSYRFHLMCCGSCRNASRVLTPGCIRSTSRPRCTRRRSA